MESIHGWFELTYADYLAIPRSVLQSMPDEWQNRFVACLEELDEHFEWRRSGCWVKFKDRRGRFMRDELANYNRGRRRFTPAELKQLVEAHEEAYQVVEFSKRNEPERKGE